MTDEVFMKRAIALAKRGAGRVSPNPLVGAVIVKDGRIISQGYHHCCGEAHAEIDAIDRAQESIAGATLYVNLEPCCHQGRTAPCVDAIIRHRLARVVVGTLDPNPLVSGRGLEILARQGIRVDVGVLERECHQLNEVFFKWMKTGLPFVTLKYAQSMDGRIATAGGHCRWISSLKSLKFAHRLRALHDGIIVGSGTALKDDPELTTRLARGGSPLRIVVDSRLSLPLEARILQNQDQARTIIATTKHADRGKRQLLANKGIEVLSCGEAPDGSVDLEQLLFVLGQRSLTSLLVEGGAKLLTSFLKARLADRLVVIQAPKIIGAGIEAVGALGVTTMAEAIRVDTIKSRRLGDDIIIDGRIDKDSGPPRFRQSPS